METVIIAYIEDVLKMRVRDIMRFFKKNDIEIVNMSFNYSDSPYKCVIKTRDKK